MSTAVVGANSSLGHKVLGMLAEQLPGSAELTAVEADEPFDGADTVIHLLAGDHDALASKRLSAVTVTDQVLQHATAAGATHLIVLSSAMVYGAWPNNPVPLTEDAPIRPGLDFDFVVQLAQVEAMVEQWRTEAAGRSATVLRPALTMAADGSPSIVRALAAGMGLELDDEDAPAQFLHLDDLASAVATAYARRLDGVYNVAPDHWVSGPRVRALSGQPPRLKLPAQVAERVAAWRWRFQRGPIPPGLQRYVRSPWLVANDKLRSTGWQPTVTNEQAYVEGTEERWWTMLTPKRKQELSLGLTALIGVGGLAAAIRAVVRARRRVSR